MGVFSKGLSPFNEGQLTGIVTKCTENAVTAAFDELPYSIDLSAHNGSLQLVKLANDITYRRQRRYKLLIYRLFVIPQNLSASPNWTELWKTFFIIAAINSLMCYFLTASQHQLIQDGSL